MRNLVPTLTCLALAACGRAAEPAAPEAPPSVPAEAPVAPDLDAVTWIISGTSGADAVAGRERVQAALRAAFAAAPRPWIDPRGTSIVGFGILRLVPSGSAPATFRIRYREVPDGYAAAGNLQLFVLPGDAFAAADRAYAGQFLAFTRTADEAATDEDGALRLETSVRADHETTVLVCYGPWTAPDAGRPAGDVPTFSLDVASDDGAYEWVESEAGEMITTNWTNRPEVTRGDSAHDPVADAPVFIEVRPMILYDARLVRAAGEPETSPEADTVRALRAEAERLAADGHPDLATDRRERADDLEAHLARADHRLVLVPSLAEKFRRVPIRWR